MPVPLLLIDDDLISREVIALTLGMAGYQVRTVACGEEAMAALGTEALPATGLILADTQMQGLSGAALIDALRQASSARILLISGSQPPAALIALADGFLLKPITAESLAAALASRVPDEAMLDTGAAIPTEEFLHQPTLDKLRAMMKPAALNELFVALAADLATRVIALKIALGHDDAAEVRRIAHAIRGGCAMVGLVGVRDAAVILELDIDTARWPQALSQLEAHRDQLNRWLHSGVLR